LLIELLLFRFRNAAATARLWILGLAPLLLLCFLAIKRFYTKKPFLPSKQQRSSEVINVKEFLELYPKEDLPSQAPVEELKGMSTFVVTWVEIAILTVFTQELDFGVLV